MAWDSDLVLMVRILIGDHNSPQTHEDDYIKSVLITAGIMVDAEIPFSYDYIYSLSDSTIVPDPVTSDDQIFMALVPLKAACILTQSDFKNALGQGIKVRDGDSQIDTSVSFKGYKDILELGPCAAYEKLRWSLLASGEASSVGKAVLGPNRVPGNNAYDTITWYYDQFVTERGRK